MDPARKEFYEAFIKFSESLSGLGDANLLKKHVGFVVNKIVIGYKNAEKKSYTAFTVRYQHEYLLWCYKKSKILMPVKEEQGKWGDVFTEQVKRHSQKPEHAYEMIEAMFPNVEKIELFARNTRNGWDCWGNEV